MSEAKYRTATLPEVAMMLDWAAEEGWNPGLDDAAAFYAADPGGFFVAVVDGVPVAAISVVNHSDSLAFLGLYLCRPEFRGQGIGYGLWNHALDHAGSRTIGLDGVPAQDANDAKSGFVRSGQTRRFVGTLAAASLDLPIAGRSDMRDIARLDRQATGVERPAFLTAWAADGDTRKTVVLPGASGLDGFATARLCREGCKVGPIVAPSADKALYLATQAAVTLRQSQVIIDAPESGVAFVALLEPLGFTEVFSTARMYRGRAPVAGDTAFGIATMELG